MKNVKEILAQNLTRLRLEHKLTQAELAQKLNYTDKSVSKWEHGDATPPIDVLVELSDLYEVSLDYLVSEDTELFDRKVDKSKENSTNKLIITLLSGMAVWLMSTVIFVAILTFLEQSFWQVFVWAVPITAIVGLVFNGIWGKRRWRFVLISILIWGFLGSVYLTLIQYNLWVIFLLGIPTQICVILWANLKTKHIR